MTTHSSTVSSTNLTLASLPGIAKIHEDTLAQIFFLLSRDIHISWIMDENWDWVSITEVCRHWHAVATRTPKLWSFLDNFRNTNRLQKSIQLSKDADLTIIYSNMGAKEFGNLKIAMKEMGRITRLVLSAHFHEFLAAELLPYFELPAPRMQAIDILAPGFGSLPQFRLPSALPGVLKRVSLINIKSPSLISHLTHLSSLALSFCDFSLSALRNILGASPMLTELLLVHCNIDCTNPLTTEPVRLPRLSIIDLQLNEFSVGCKILQTIDAPNTSNCTIKLMDAIDMNNIAELDVFSKLLKRDHGADSDSISIRANHVSHFRERSSFNVFMEKENTSYLDLVLHLDQHADMNMIIQRWVEIFECQLMQISSLDIEADDDAITAETWIKLFRACTSTKTLTLRLGSEFHHGESCLKALAHTHTPQNKEHAESLVPNLEHLTARWNGFWEGTEDPDLFARSMEDVLEIRLTNGYPVRIVTLRSDSDFPKFEVTVRDDLKELRQWAKEVKKIREKVDDIDWEIYDTEDSDTF